MASVPKSILAAPQGIAIADGKIKASIQNVIDCFSDAQLPAG
jgi:hypothetical protein